MIKWLIGMKCLIKQYLLAFALPIAAYPLGAYSAELLDETRTTIREWVETEQAISHEKSQWREERASLTTLLSILRAEEETLNEEIALAQDIASRADEERLVLVEQLSSYQEVSALLEVLISDYERQLKIIESYLPQVLRSELQPRLNRLQQERTSHSLSERTQNVLNILAEIESFDSRITLASELISVEQDQSIEARILYLGLSKAFFVNESATISGYGSPFDTGWQWRTDETLSGSIVRAIDVYETRLTPQLVTLPLKVD
ncbi:MAG: DUF3450 family protein [Gammaproteobacteria bacterium]|jgi:chromosome segregation ATPase